MEDLPENLDDGEIWLPSDIFQAVDQEDHHLHHHHRPISGSGYRMQDLDRQFCNLNLLDRHRILASNVPLISKRLEVRAKKALTAPPPNGCFGLTVGPSVDRALFDFGTPPIFAAPDSSFRYAIHKPIHHQAASTIESLKKTRIGRASSKLVLEGKQTWPTNPFFPIQASHFKLGCSTRDPHGCTIGTGVFIPHATNIATRSTSQDIGKGELGVTPHRDRAGS